MNFSATGRGPVIAKYAATLDQIGALLVTSLTIKTSWRRTQSRANPSPPKFPANREKYREFRLKSGSLSARRRGIAPALCHLHRLTVPKGAFLTGNFTAPIRESSSLIPVLENGKGFEGDSQATTKLVHVSGPTRMWVSRSRRGPAGLLAEWPIQSKICIALASRPAMRPIPSRTQLQTSAASQPGPSRRPTC